MRLDFADDIALTFALLFARSSGMLMTLPPMLGVRIPVRVRVLLAAVISAALLPVAELARPRYYGLAVTVMLSMGAEVVTGILFSFGALIASGAVMTAAEAISGAMELSSGPILRQMSQAGGATAVAGPLTDGLNALAAILFFIAGLHRAILFALGISVKTLPLGTLAAPSFEAVLSLAGQMLTIALQLALPMLVPLMVLAMVQGVLSRFVPQMNLLMVGPAAMIIAGLVLLILYSSSLGLLIIRVWQRIADLNFRWLHG